MAEGQPERHLCAWPGCKRRVRSWQWGCSFHWSVIPRYLRFMWRRSAYIFKGDAAAIAACRATIAGLIYGWIAKEYAKECPFPPDATADADGQEMLPFSEN